MTMTTDLTPCERHELGNCGLCKPKVDPATGWDGLDGRLADLRAGRLGYGTFGAMRFKRYLVQAKVEWVAATPKARTRLHVKFEGKAVMIMDYRYPVQYKREEA